MTFLFNLLLPWHSTGQLASWPPMLRLLSSKAQGCKDFGKTFKPCHVGIHRKGLPKYSQTNTHVPGFQSFLVFLHHFILAKLATSSIRVKMSMAIHLPRSVLIRLWSICVKQVSMLTQNVTGPCRTSNNLDLLVLQTFTGPIIHWLQLISSYHLSFKNIWGHFCG